MCISGKSTFCRLQCISFHGPCTLINLFAGAGTGLSFFARPRAFINSSKLLCTCVLLKDAVLEVAQLQTLMQNLI